MELQLYNVLKATLDPNSETRQQAEIQLKEFEFNPDYGSLLMKIASSPELEPDVRQSSLFILKANIDSNWTLGNEKYTHGPATSQASKQFTREKAFELFGDSNAYVVSTIGKYDWPEEWPEMFQLLLQVIKTGNPDQVTSAMIVFKEIITRDLSSDQLQELTLLLPEFMGILNQENAFSVETRTIAVQIFGESIELLSILELETSGPNIQMLKSMISTWIQKLLQILSLPITPETVDVLALKFVSINALKNLSLAFSEYFNPFYTKVLSTVCSELSLLTEQYQVQYIVPFDHPIHSEPWVSNFLLDDATSVDLALYITMLFEYSSVNVKNKLSKDFFKTQILQGNDQSSNLEQVLLISFQYAQISSQTAEDWENDIEQLINDIEEYNSLFTVRQSVKEFIQNIADRFQVDFISSFVRSASTFLQKPLGTAFSKDRIDESILYILEITSGVFLKFIHASTSNPALPDSKLFIINLILQNIQSSTDIFSFGRTFLLAGVYCRIIPESSLIDIIKASIEVAAVVPANSHLIPLFSNPVVQVYSLMACSRYCEILPTEVMRQFYAQIINKAINILETIGHDVISISLECILSSVKDESVKEQLEPAISPILVSSWLEYGNDPVLLSLISDLIAELSKNYNCFVNIFTKFSPVIKQVFKDSESEKVSSAIEILSGILYGGGRSQIPEKCIHDIYPELMTVLYSSEDNTVFQNGQECLKYMVQSSLQAIVEYEDTVHNLNGLQILFQFIGKFLNPQSSESSALFIGDLISKVIIKGEKINAISGDTLAELVFLLVRKLATSKSSVFASSLLPCICLLMVKSATQVIDLLSNISVDGTNGENLSGLQVFFEKWMECASDIQGVYFNKVSIMAMINVAVANDPRVNEIIVNVPIKIVKLLLSEYASRPSFKNEMTSILSKPSKKSVNTSDLNSDDSWSDEEGLTGVDLSQFINDDGENPFSGFGDHSKNYRTYSDFSFDEDDDADDPDIVNSPIYNIDINTQIQLFAKQCERSDPQFGNTITPYLTSYEAKMLNKLLK
ncbi:hypothetical protein BB560_000841 [Smittium megazygosporum]|uniref:Importin N-terminal domain-containing protein n=1 Tax=Smittium megazygosporum TaxID=133381 RepID=A0A2T9ZJ87_9FUNG|nr:hypothetical protein BB560_000841 [Smittium megazygosporum]